MARSGRHAVVTGAAGGIGQAIVRELLRSGATVHGLDRNAAAQLMLAKELGAQYHAYTVDLADRSASNRTHAQLLETLGGRCDILVNNVGVAGVVPFESSDDVLLDMTLAVNFVAAFRLTRALLPALRASGRASVVNIASELALVGQSGYSAYCASKGALLAWSRALAVELAGEGIRVNAICPGPIDTRLLAAEFASCADPGEARRAEIATVPAGRLGVPKEVATVVGFLAGDSAAFVSGAAWSVDGGKTAR